MVQAVAFYETKFLEEPKMARVSTYLNFPRSTEAAFTFYAQCLDGKITAMQRNAPTVAQITRNGAAKSVTPA